MSTNWSPQVARVMHELSNAAPPAPSVARLRDVHPSTPRRPPIAVTVAAVMMAAAAVVGVIVVANRDGSTSVSGPPAGIEVDHTRIEITLDGQLDCETPIDTVGTFATMVIDTYADRPGRQWRNQVTYPDGTTRDLVATGSAVYPSGLYERGEYQGSTLGCVGPDGESFVLGAEPGQGGFYTLNVADELAAEERSLVTGFDKLGTPVAGDHVDSRGRPSELWEQRVDGFAGYGSDASFPVVQITSWWVDPANGATVTERRYSNTVDQLGSITETASLVTDETTTVPAGFFDTSGYRQLDPVPRPTINDPTDATNPSPTPPTTSSVGASASLPTSVTPTEPTVAATLLTVAPIEPRSGMLETELGTVHFDLPNGTIDDPIGGNPTADFVVGHSFWVVQDCCRLKIVAQNVKPLVPHEDLLGDFKSADLDWSVYDTGDPASTTLFATTTIGAISVNVLVQSLQPNDASLNGLISEIAEQVAQSITIDRKAMES